MRACVRARDEPETGREMNASTRKPGSTRYTSVHIPKIFLPDIQHRAAGVMTTESDRRQWRPAGACAHDLFRLRLACWLELALRADG
jgi:hypothetical protein